MVSLRFVKSIFSTVSLCLLVTSSVTVAQENQSKLSLQWLGGPTVLIKFGPLQLLTDPMLGEGEQAYQMGNPNEMFDLAKGPNIIDYKRLTVLPDLNINDIDLSILSHTHEDHFDQSAQKRLDKQLPFIVPTGATEKLAAQGFTNIRELDWGQHWRLSEMEIQMQSRQFQGLLETTSTLLRLDPTLGTASFYKAIGHYSLGQFAEAEKSARTAIDSPNRPPPEARYMVGTLLARKGAWSEAVKELETYLQVAPNSPRAASARQILAEAKSRLAQKNPAPAASNP